MAEDDEKQPVEPGYASDSGAKYPAPAEQEGDAAEGVDLTDAMDMERETEELVESGDFLGNPADAIDEEDGTDPDLPYAQEDAAPSAVASMLSRKPVRYGIGFLGACAATFVIMQFLPPQNAPVPSSIQNMAATSADNERSQAVASTGPAQNGTLEPQRGQQPAKLPTTAPVSVSLGDGPPGGAFGDEAGTQPSKAAPALNASAVGGVSSAQGASAATAAPFEPASEELPAHSDTSSELAALKAAQDSLARQVRDLGQALLVLSERPGDDQLAKKFQAAFAKTEAALDDVSRNTNTLKDYMAATDAELASLRRDMDARFDRLSQGTAQSTEAPAAATPRAVETAVVTAAPVRPLPQGPGEWVVVSVNDKVAWVAPRNDRLNPEAHVRLAEDDAKSRFGAVLAVTTDANGRFIVKTADGIITEG